MESTKSKENQMKIAVGIPFMASIHTSALRLCLLSLYKYADFDFDVYLLVDCTNKQLAISFDENRLLSEFPKIHIRHHSRLKAGDYKQALIDWVVMSADCNYAIIMHSDVFLYKNGLMRLLIEPLIDDNDAVASFWLTPLVLYNSTFHANEAQKKTCLLHLELVRGYSD